jgi:methylenetetrahydrofolate reductase (NADPH)
VVQRTLSRDLFRLRRSSAGGKLDGASRTALNEVLAQPTFEILPLPSVEPQITHLPAAVRVSVTASPSKPIEATVELAARLRVAGFQAVPHIAARMIRDQAHLRDLLTRIEDAGVERLFVVAGDGEPMGEFADGLTLLQAMADNGHRFAEIGVPCYPQGHPFIPDERLAEALMAKARFASYMTTQLCFDAGAISRWILRRRADGLLLPAVIGLPGVVEPRRLLAVAAQIGVRDTQRFLRKNLALVGRLIRSTGHYRPDKLLTALAPLMADPEAGIRGIHLYTFNQVEATEAWRTALQARLRASG